MADNVCRNCKWAKWQMTKHAKPRVKPEEGGECLYPVDRIALPNSIRVRSWSRAGGEVCDQDKQYIRFYSDQPCRVWENKAVVTRRAAQGDAE